MWVFRIKRDHLNNVVEYKAHLCAQGFTQTPGVDFDKTYAPIGRLNSLWFLIAHAALKRLHFHQIDVKSAFLNAPLAEIVYLSIPQGLEIDQQRSCLCLKKAIYGLKQVPLCTLTWLYIHVDDIAIFGEDISTFKKEIAQEFDLKDMGCAELMLGIKVTHGIGLLPLKNWQNFDPLELTTKVQLAVLIVSAPPKDPISCTRSALFLSSLKLPVSTIGMAFSTS
ncbi:hypothetical protein O181_085574 [Austropuccinia psidii MF-1]|uniref:Reverse transcriptase Ty1/copia-type domain-containing protein n=1 Tax=Austropuccinia psidii MF-1 TaxID=1389203 RepID=A0A9Q3IN13_9BASI|nr:hypothetical protein [Austropuccinia psidii MF-1]